MPAAQASPAGDDDGADLHGQIDNHAYSPPPQVVPREAAIRFATAASITIARTSGDRLPMLIQGFYN
jgi:hypothetical protein